MKKLTLFACAFLLTSIAFTSCKDKENEPTKQEEVVKTEFSIALPDQVKSKNRMPSSTVQIGGRTEFQGMTGITLIPFVKTSAILSTDTRLGDNITLTDIADASALGTNSNAKVYTDVAIPLTTSAFLFYAKSAATGSKFEVGSLEEANALAVNTDEPADLLFELEPIQGDYNTNIKNNADAVALVAYLNSIANATDGTKAWKAYNTTDGDDAAMIAMFETYSTLHVLSSAGIARMLVDLYNSLDPFSTTLATNIKAAIANTTYATLGGSAGARTLTLVNANFPISLNLPSESVHITWDTDHFRICESTEYTTANHANPSLITYPASLWYFANSRINTSNQSQKDRYNGTNTWSQILGYHTDATAVNTKTRAVAITDPIQYAVARLDVQVKLASGTLDDNTPVTAQEITCASYPVTAVLVGGQKNVGFDFTPVGTTDYMIYDNVMTSSTMAATTSYSDMNSTLVLETAEDAGGHAQDVRIAVEFTNASGKDFIGVDGCLIPAGGKFYVVATLEADDATETGNKVFKQDYTTTVKLNLLTLKGAYNTIPDLRTPKLELGFSVDLDWTAGHTYEVNIN